MKKFLLAIVLVNILMFPAGLMLAQDSSELPLLIVRLDKDSNTKVDASLTLASSDHVWRSALVGCNLTDEIRTNFGNGGAGRSGFFIV